MVREAPPIVEMTTPAVEKLKAILEEEKAPDAALRVVVVPAGHGVQYLLTLETEPKEDDILSVVEGVRVEIDEDSAPLMEGAQIDYVEDLMRSGFVITNPNVAMGGGCGGGCGGNCACGASH
jgi:iron-sulfur cluster assembly accessory protein